MTCPRKQGSMLLSVIRSLKGVIWCHRLRKHRSEEPKRRTHYQRSQHEVSRQKQWPNYQYNQGFQYRGNYNNDHGFNDQGYRKQADLGQVRGFKRNNLNQKSGYTNAYQNNYYTIPVSHKFQGNF